MENLTNFFESEIKLCENSKMYIFAEFYRNILIQYKKLTENDFLKLLDFNIKNSNSYFFDELLKIKNNLLKTV